MTGDVNALPVMDPRAADSTNDIKDFTHSS